MLEVFRKGTATLATALIFSAGIASAEDHSVIILDQAYFPAVIYVQPGDTVVFSNESGGEHTITAQNDAWTTGPIASGMAHQVLIETGMQSAFGGLAVDAVYMEGSLDFNPPPNN